MVRRIRWRIRFAERAPAWVVSWATEESATVCLRFVVRRTYGRFVTYDEIDCP
jgi:hypothetical protein